MFVDKDPVIDGFITDRTPMSEVSQKVVFNPCLTVPHHNLTSVKRKQARRPVETEDKAVFLVIEQAYLFQLSYPLLITRYFLFWSWVPEGHCSRVLVAEREAGFGYPSYQIFFFEICIL